jgi:hypothetical protein
MDVNRANKLRGAVKAFTDRTDNVERYVTGEDALTEEDWQVPYPFEFHSLSIKPGQVPTIAHYVIAFMWTCGHKWVHCWDPRNKMLRYTVEILERSKIDVDIIQHHTYTQNEETREWKISGTEPFMHSVVRNVCEKELRPATDVDPGVANRMKALGYEYDYGCKVEEGGCPF